MPALDHLARVNALNTILERVMAALPAKVRDSYEATGLPCGDCIDAAYRAVLNAQQLRNNKIGRGFPVLTKPRPVSDDHPGRVAPGGCGSSSGVVSAFAIATLRRAFPTLPASAAAGQPYSWTRVHDRRLVHGHDVDQRLGVRHPQRVAEERPSNYVLPQCILPSGQWHPSWTYAIDAIATIDTVIAWLTVGHCYASGRAPLRAMRVLSALPVRRGVTPSGLSTVECPASEVG
jgi:hypothetical protein